MVTVEGQKNTITKKTVMNLIIHSALKLLIKQMSCGLKLKQSTLFLQFRLILHLSGC